MLVPVSFPPHRHTPQKAANESIRVILSKGRCVEVPDFFSEDTLTRLLEVLERR